MNPKLSLKKPEVTGEDPAVTRAGVRQRALGLLSRREHSRAELQRKLRSRGFDAGLIENVLDDLHGERLQCDARYVESYIRVRSERGYGPLRLQAELRERGIPDSQITAALNAAECDWSALIQALWQKKFHGQVPRDVRERARQMRFFQQRGFAQDSLRTLYASAE